jgi:hypothetical protein
MGLLDINLNDAKEPKAVEADKEYIIRWVDTNEGIDKNGHAYIQVILDVPQESDAKSFTHFVGLPYEGMEPKQLNNCKWRLKLLLEAFGVDHTRPINLDECKGRQAWAILGVSEDDQYGKQNFVKKYIRPA